MNPTFLAHIRTLLTKQDEWIESSSYADGESLKAALQEQGYEVVDIVDLDDVKMW